MRKNTGFTLVEVLVAVALTGVILLTGYSAFQKIMQSQSRLGAAIDVQKNLFYTNEKMAALIRDGGTIDYEEYFNRRMLGYGRSMVDTSIDTETAALDTYTFTNFSHFGNGNVAIRPPIYYCGVGTSVIEEACLGTNAVYPPLVPPVPTLQTLPTGHQTYGQYAALALNYLDPVGFPMPIKLPRIFEDHATNADVLIFDRIQNKVISQNARNVGLPELYLIKRNLNNNYTRTYFRHVYVDDSFVDDAVISCDPTKDAATSPTANINGCLGKIQMTKLEACDESPEDGIIEAWIPHSDFFIGNSVDNNCPTTAQEFQTSAHEDTVATESPNLKWVDVTAPEMNVIRATFLPNPLKIPALMSGAGDSAQSPSVSVYLEVQLSTKLRNKSFVRTTMNYPRTLITTYDLSE